MMFDLPRDESPIIKVIGVGGGGSNAVTHMYNQGIVGVDFAICNTDSQAMDISPVPSKIQLGPNLTEGRGAGSKPDVGKRACEESIEEVKQYLTNNCKMLFITAGMGGGTGTGAAPIIAKTAQEMGILTVGIVTLPFTFEGRRRTSQGMQGLAELKSSVDTLIVVSNDKLRQIHGNLSLSDAFSQADDILSTAAKGIAEIITVPGYVNVDFEDVNTVMRASGVAIMGTASAEGDDRAKRAVDDALHSPLLEDNDIRGAQHILLNITSGNKEVTMDEIFEITEFVQEEAGYGTDLIWGNCFDEKLGDKISVTVIATGFEHKHRKRGCLITPSSL
jgi:cell division protein FtsZ